MGMESRDGNKLMKRLIPTIAPRVDPKSLTVSKTKLNYLGLKQLPVPVMTRFGDANMHHQATAG